MRRILRTYASTAPTILNNPLTLTKRNVVWAERLDNDFKVGSKNIFVSCGMEHLYGEGSLCKLLREKGYTVEAIGD